MDKLKLHIALLISSLIVFGCTSSVRYAEKVKSKPSNPSNRDYSESKLSQRSAPPITGGEIIKERDSRHEGTRTETYSSIGEKIAADAYKWIGTPYRWGGESSKGMDCSGLVVSVFSENSYFLPRTAQGQFEYLPKLERVDDLKKGDLVFFSYSKNKINHVGIYTGNGNMVHSSTSRGVIEEHIFSSWFSDKFVGGCRVIQ
ncbi:MAG: hypothetical protein Kapaf2KO_06440 [Candidatus Kapaibacteriales bacterium]